MCGYVGFTSLKTSNRTNDASSVIENMMDTIKHRGPDSSGKYVDDDIALGFRRLSIIDLAQGSQPLYNEDSTLVLVFNGEIYNYRELRQELIAHGHSFRTETDSEVLLHGYTRSRVKNARPAERNVFFRYLEHQNQGVVRSERFFRH